MAHRLGLALSTFLASIFAAVLSTIGHAAYAANTCTSTINGSCMASTAILNHIEYDDYDGNGGANHTITGDESTCTTSLYNERHDGDGDPARTQINDSNPYKDIYWISNYGTPSKNVNVNAGASSVSLQLNYMQFICAVLVHNNTSTSANIDDTSSKVTSSNFPNDRAVYPDSVTPHGASRYELRTQIQGTGWSVSSGGGSLSGIDPNLVLKASRQSSHRYWVSGSTENFSYIPPGGVFTDGLNVTLKVPVKIFQTYHDVLGGGNDINTCKGTGGIPGTPITSESSIPWSKCLVDTLTVKLHIIVNAPKIVVNAGGACVAGKITGTVTDENYPSSSIPVELYKGTTVTAANKVGSMTVLPSNHTFSFTLGSTSDWTDQSYTIKAYGPGNDQDKTKTFTVKHCGTVLCGGQSGFSPGGAGTPFSYQVYMKVQYAATGPPGSPAFTISVTGSGTGTNSKAAYSAASQAMSGGKVYSVTQSFTPAATGTYTVKWSFYGTTGCQYTARSANTPYFSVTGGDISVGNGVGDGDCSESLADITSWSTNATTSPNYTGGNTQMAALATGDINNFVSGMGLGPSNSTATGAGSFGLKGHGLSFANLSNGETNTPINYGGGFNYGGASGSNSLPCVPDYYSHVPTDSDDTPVTVLGSGGATSAAFTSANVPTQPSSPTTYNFSVNPSSDTSDVGNPSNHTAGFTLTIGGGSAGDMMIIPPNVTINLYVFGNVYIKNQIHYGSYTQTSIPRFNLYVEGNIYIDPSVNDLHGVYVAQETDNNDQGILVTCAESPSTNLESYAKCSAQQLVFYGAVFVENELRLNRTLGSTVAGFFGNPPAAPAEIFRYSPELWVGQTGSGNLQTQTYTSLPPVL